jgi:hypothetical protein
VFTADRDYKPEEWVIERQSLAAINRLKLEVRGGDLRKSASGASSNQHSMMPGSIHPITSEEVEWLDGPPEPHDIPPEIKLEDLFAALRRAEAAALLAEYWPEGSRNFAGLHVAGMLWRVHTEEQKADEDRRMTTSFEEAQDWFALVLDLADDKEKRNRIENFKATWRKADQGQEVTGALKLSEMIGELDKADVNKGRNTKIIYLLYALLSDDHTYIRQEEMAQKFSVVRGEPAGMLLDMEQMREGMKGALQRPEQARVSWGDQFIDTAYGKQPITDWIIRFCRRVDAIGFNPATEERIYRKGNMIYANLWSKFEVEPAKNPVPDAAVRPFIDHIMEVIACGDPERYHWVMAWLADIFQDPGNKPNTCLILTGVQGAGKDFLGRAMARLMGQHLYHNAGKLNALLEKHNHMLSGRLLLHAEETASHQQRAASMDLKSLVTSTTIEINPKNVNQYSVDHCARIMLTSNSADPVMLEPTRGDRRYTILETSEHRKILKDGDANEKYWEQLWEWIKEDVNASNLMRWFKDFKYDKRTIRKPLNTRAKQEAQAQHIPPVAAWLVTRLREDFIISEECHAHWSDAFNWDDMGADERRRETIVRMNWPTHFVMEALEKDFLEFSRKHGHKLHDRNVAGAIRQYLPRVGEDKWMTVNKVDQKGRTIKARKRVYQLQTRAELAAILEERLPGIMSSGVAEALETITENTEEVPKKSGKKSGLRVIEGNQTGEY